jgi:hypothetical protein
MLEEQVQGNSSYNIDLNSLNSGIYILVLQHIPDIKIMKKVIEQ